jgi:hypothetical protein
MAITGSTIAALSQQMPGQNQKVATGLQEAAKTQMRQQLAGQGPMPVQQIQAIGQQAAAQQGQAKLQVQQQGAQEAQKLGGLALNQDQQDKQMKLQARQLDLAKQARKNTELLNNLDSELKSRLLDDQFQFQQDELGRTLFNERQLMDYKIQTAKSDLEMQDFEDKMRQASQRKLQLLQSAQARLDQELKQGFQRGQQRLDQEMQTRLAQAKRDLEEKIRKERAKQANRASMFSAGGAIAGALGAAAIIGTGGGAAPLIAGMAGGSSLGSGLGSIIYGTER